MNQKKVKALRRSALINFNKVSSHNEPFKHYMKRIKQWFLGLNHKERAKLVPHRRMI